MKRYLGTLAALCIMTTALAGTITIAGESKQIDTLEHRTLGPGVSYTRFHMSDYPLNAYMMTIDLNNPYNKVETFQASNIAGKTEAMTNAYKRLSSDSHKTLAGINGNFWIVPGQGQPDALLGVSHSGSILNGEMITDPNDWNRNRPSTEEGMDKVIGFAVLDEARKTWIDDMKFDGYVEINGLGQRAISQINRIRNTDDLVFFNHYVGSKTRSDNAGTEVFIKPENGTSWAVNKPIKCIVTRVIKDKGANEIQEGESVLSGSGSGQTYLNSLQVGDVVTVNMGVYTCRDKTRPNITQMVTGNALVMDNGLITSRNENESYNSTLYPRTGIGCSADGKTLYLIVIDKGNGSAGATTRTMCGILKACGAVYATQMDGGGSAQMMVEGNIINKPADGKERAVANGWFVYNIAPEDDTVSHLSFFDNTVDVPSYAAYTPQIIATNQYGTIIHDTFKDYTLTCDAALGTISADGKSFIAGKTQLSGNLIATYNGVSVTKKINVIAGGRILFRLDSLLIDQRRSYSLEVSSKAGSSEMSIDPARLSYTISDPSICEVQQGVLRGMKNGTTTLIGNLDGFKDTLIVNVEIPTSGYLLFDDFSNPSNYTITAPTNWNLTFDSNNLPSNWSYGRAMNYTYQTNRAPMIKLAGPVTLYSLPDSIKIHLNMGGVALTKAIISMRANNESSDKTIEFTAIPTNSDYNLTVDCKSIFDTEDIATYPLHFNYLTLNISATSQVVGTSYAIGIREIGLYYHGLPVSIKVPTASNGYLIFPNPVTNDVAWIEIPESNSRLHSYEIITLQGQIIQSGTLEFAANNRYMLSLSNINSGSYIVRISDNKQIGYVKIIKN